MSFECVERINALKKAIEEYMGQSYDDLTEAVQALKDDKEVVVSMEGASLETQEDGSGIITIGGEAIT